jgi:hypothetical protein
MEEVLSLQSYPTDGDQAAGECVSAESKVIIIICPSNASGA